MTTLSATPYHRLLRTFETAPAWLILALLAWAFLRGFALHPEPYGLGQYFYTYEAGFLIRGLMGTAVTWIAGPDPMSMYAFISTMSDVLYLGFIATLWWVYSRLRRDPPRDAAVDNLLFVVLLSGPLMVGIGATRGFHDTLILALGLLAHLLYERERFLASLLLFALASLIHEQIAFFILPVIGWNLWRHPGFRGLRLPWRPTLTLIAMCAVTVLIVRTGKADATQIQLLLEKVTAALQTPYLDKWADPYLTVFAAANDVSLNITTENYLRLTARSTQFMVVPSLAFLGIGVWVLLRRRRRLDALVFTFANLAPHTLYLFAYDVHRYVCYASLTSFLLLLETLRREPESVRLPAWLKAALVVLILAQVATLKYDSVHWNARNSTPLYELGRAVLGVDAVPETRVGTAHR